MVSLDFVEGLPLSNGKNCILIMVDKFSKYNHSVPLAHRFTALTVAKFFMEKIYRLHGLPQSIVSNRGRVFTSRLWQEFFLSEVLVQYILALGPRVFSFLCALWSAAPTLWHELIQRLPNRRRSLTGFRRRRLSLTVETPPSQVTSCSRTASTQLTTPSGCLQLRRPPHAASADGAPLPPPLPQEGARGLLRFRARFASERRRHPLWSRRRSVCVV